MRIIFDDEDLKGLENALARALVRAAKTLARDGFFAAMFTAPAQEDAPPPEPVVPAPEPAATSAAETVAPLNGTSTGLHTPAPATPVQPPPSRAKRRSIASFVRAVEFRPDGYADVEDVAKSLFGKNATQSQRTMIAKWAFDLEVKALIVTSAKPPNKGLPGRLMIERQSARERDALRLRNKDLPPMHRIAPAKVAEMPRARHGEITMAT